MQGIQIELERVFPHGGLENISDVRTALKIFGRDHISGADVSAIVKYLDAMSQWRKDRSMKWLDIINYVRNVTNGG